MVAVTIDDHAGQAVAFAPDDATKLGVDIASRAIFRRLRDPALKKIQIEILPATRETPRHNLRFAVVDRAADQMIAAVFERDDIAVHRVAEGFQHLAREDPIVAVQNARARFDDEAGHGEEANVQRPTLNVQRSTNCSLLDVES